MLLREPSKLWAFGVSILCLTTAGAVLGEPNKDTDVLPPEAIAALRLAYEEAPLYAAMVLAPGVFADTDVLSPQQFRAIRNAFPEERAAD